MKTTDFLRLSVAWAILLLAGRGEATLSAAPGNSDSAPIPRDRELGRETARQLALELHPRDRVILLRRQIQCTAAEQREEGFLEVMIRHHPEIDLVATDYHAGPTSESARRVMTTLLERYGRNLQGIFVSTETSATGALAALRAQGLLAGGVRVFVAWEGGDLGLAESERGLVRRVPARAVSPPLSAALTRASQSLILSEGAARPAPQVGERVVPDLGLVLVSIPAGEVRCARPDGGVWRVRLSRPFWLGKYEVTQSEWQAVMAGNPSSFVSSDRPVDGVSWNDATDFCTRLTQRERQAGRLPAGWVYALPTEAQWEYACRAGGPAVEITPMKGWSRENSGALHAVVAEWRMSTHPVGARAANAWGLHDMLGNVAEWCADWSADYPAEAAVDDYAGPSVGTHRVLRGGSWWSDPQNCRSDHRHRAPPDRQHSALGFRIALVPVISS